MDHVEACLNLANWIGLDCKNDQQPSQLLCNCKLQSVKVKEIQNVSLGPYTHNLV